jgi:hypothetical protein
MAYGQRPALICNGIAMEGSDYKSAPEGKSGILNNLKIQMSNYKSSLKHRL